MAGIFFNNNLIWQDLHILALTGYNLCSNFGYESFCFLFAMSRSFGVS